MITPENYMLALEDGLDVRISQEYARDKLYALQAYLYMARNAMKNRPWYAFNYIDLQAGPGKNRINDQIHLGSPLIALTIRPPFTHYWFNEIDSHYADVLQARVSQSPLLPHVRIFRADANETVDPVVGAITAMDKEAKETGKWSTFNIAFLDPEGLEINWETVRQLASVPRMDLIINFSTVGINRNFQQHPDVVDRFFGGNDWRNLDGLGDSTLRRRQLINLYRKHLEDFGYHIASDETLAYHDISMRNSKNAEVYSLIFASKHQLGDDFWRKVKDQIERLRHGGSRPLL